MFGYSYNGSDGEMWGSTTDEYYFYMNFKPYTDFAVCDCDFRMWFQMGDNTTSDWEGVRWENTTSSLTSNADMVQISATDSNKTAGDEAQWDDDSEFRGIVYHANNGSDYVDYLEIWRFIPRWEQTLDDGTFERIERGRLLRMNYVLVNNGSSTTDSTTFEVTLKNAVSHTIGLALVLVTAMELAF